MRGGEEIANRELRIANRREKKFRIANCSRRPINVFTRKRESVWREGKGNRQLSIADLGNDGTNSSMPLWSGVGSFRDHPPKTYSMFPGQARKHLRCFRDNPPKDNACRARLPIIFNNILGTSCRGYNLQFAVYSLPFTIYYSPFTIHKLFTIHWFKT